MPMLSRAELERLSSTVSGGNVGQAEKLYLQDIVLATISRETVTELVFEGGTALLKVYQLDRFSEDLDFTARDDVDYDALVRAAIRDLENYGAVVAEHTSDETTSMYRTRFGIEGPQYTGERQSLSFLRIEVNKRSTARRVRTRRYTPQFPDVRSFELAVLDASEILAEKIRALCTREQPRDLYDIYHLLESSAELEPALAQEKLDYYDIEFDSTHVLDRARRLDTSWETLDPLVYSPLPNITVVCDTLEQALTSSDS